MQVEPLGYSNDSNRYPYVLNDPLNAVDPNGLWQLTIAGGYYVGGAVTFGYNSGQWNVGGWLGGGSGISARLNIFDTGPAAPGFDVSARGQATANYGAIGGGLGMEYSLSTGSSTATVSLGIGQGYNVTTTYSDKDNKDSFTAFPTFGIGNSAYLGLGLSWRSKK